MVFSVTAPPEEVAVGYFLFVFSPTSPFSYLPEHLPALADDDDIMQAVSAPALAALGLQYRSGRLMREARSHYVKALMQMNKDLSDPRVAILDRTLLCVLLLTGFEALAFRGRGTPRDWNVHVQGSANLLALRDSAPRKTELGHHLEHQASVNILSSCILHRVPVPVTFRRLQEQGSLPKEANPELSGPDQMRRRILNFMSRLTTLRAAMKGMLATELVTECMALDAEVAVILDKLHAHMPFQIVNATSDSEELRKATNGTRVCAYKGIMHKYESQQAARLFNNMRLIRIVINEYIFCAFEPDLRGVIFDEPEPGTPLYALWGEVREQAVAQAATLIDDLLASVPYSLELLQPAFSMAARALIWPLAMAAESEVCPVAARLYIIDRLKALAYMHELDQAREAAKMLEEGVLLVDW